MDFSSAGIRPRIDHHHLDFSKVYYQVSPDVPDGKLDVTSGDLQHADIAFEIARFGGDLDDIKNTTLVWSAASVALDFRVTTTVEPLLRLAEMEAVKFDDAYCESLWNLAQLRLHGAALAGCLRALAHTVHSATPGVSDFRRNSTARFRDITAGLDLTGALASSFAADDAHAHFILSKRIRPEYPDIIATTTENAQAFLLAAISYALAATWSPFTDHRLHHERREHSREIKNGDAEVAQAIDQGLELLKSRSVDAVTHHEKITPLYGDIDAYLAMTTASRFTSETFNYHPEARDYEKQLVRRF